MIYRQPSLDLNAEISVDLFAGGGGASSGYERATGRQVDVAVNHDRAAVAMHRRNHPHTRHFQSDVFEVDPLIVTGGRPVGLLWASPDCTFHSKARGAKPIRHKEKKRRALAWVVTRWAGQVAPRVIMLENVEEFAEWGPLVGPTTALRPCRRRAGRTFRRWVRSLEVLGYQVEWRELRACDYGAPTIRKRLFVIARRDGQPIVWPAPTHGPGRAHPYRTAAECIDWSIPMLSIFATKEEARAWARERGQATPVRPLAEATQRRIARGVMRYVVNNPRPFIVPVQNGSNSAVHDSREPLRTVTAHPKGGGLALAAPILALAAPILAGVGGRAGQSPERPGDAPFQTVTSKGDAALVAPYLVPRYGERPGQEPRVRSVEEPAPVVVPSGNGGSLAAAVLVPNNTNNAPHSPESPVPTVTGGGRNILVSSFLAKHFGGVVGSALDQPKGTVTTIDHDSVVAASLAKLRGTSVDADPQDPLHTVSAGGQHHAAVTAHLTHFHSGEPAGGSSLDSPSRTVLGKPKAGLIYGFLQKYYGQGVGQALGDPAPTVTTKDRIGLVTVEVAGEPYVLADIAMRMLQPRELYRAQGFDDSYVIDHGLDEDGEIIRLTKAEQVRMCGNSVSPNCSEALIRANLPDMLAWDITPKKAPRRARRTQTTLAIQAA